MGGLLKRLKTRTVVPFTKVKLERGYTFRLLRYDNNKVKTK